METNPTESRTRWYMLALGALTNAFVVAMPTMCMPVLFKEISDDLGLSLVEIGAVWGMISLAGILTGLIGGTLGDRFGTKRLLIALSFMAGIAGAIRGTATDFATLSATILFFGFLTPAIPMNVHKICGIWFSQKQLGLANGVASAGMALGFALGSMLSATILSPALGGWRNVLFLYGGIAIVISFIWATTPTAESEHRATSNRANAPSIRQAFANVTSIRNIWILGFAIMGTTGCVQGVLGYLPLYLRDMGWSPNNADGALTAFHITSLIFAIPLTLMSDRIGSRKTILVAATIVICIGSGLLSVVSGILIWLVVIMAGAFRDGFMATIMTATIEIKGIDHAHSGTAMGFVILFSRVSNLLAPPIGNSLAGINPSLPFAFWAALATTSLVGFHFFYEGRKGAPQTALAS